MKKFLQYTKSDLNKLQLKKLYRKNHKKSKIEKYQNQPLMYINKYNPLKIIISRKKILKDYLLKN